MNQESSNHIIHYLLQINKTPMIIVQRQQTSKWEKFGLLDNFCSNWKELTFRVMCYWRWKPKEEKKMSHSSIAQQKWAYSSLLLTETSAAMILPHVWSTTYPGRLTENKTTYADFPKTHLRSVPWSIRCELLSTGILFIITDIELAVRA